MNDKKYYWIKLRTDFFNREDIDFLLSQENGCEYVVLYQMLCLNTANTGGRLESKMNEVIIPYDIKKIVRDTKYFDTDTVVVALELYKKLGLVYEEEDQILKISNIERMIGTESASREAIKKREQRLKKKLGTLEGTNCLIENRDKRLDIRDKDIDIKRENKIPTLEEVEAYCKERNNNINAKQFYEYYQVNDWKDRDGKKVKNWKQKLITWENRESKKTKKEEIDWEAFFKKVEEEEKNDNTRN